MAQQLNSINLVAPAFKGINTEDSPLAQDPSFAEIADNAVIDRRGRIASRKGNKVITTNKTELGSNFLSAIHEYRDDYGNEAIFSVGNNKILKGTTTLTDVTPSSYSINSNDWKMVTFNNHGYFFQRGHEPLVYEGNRQDANGNNIAVVERMSAHVHSTGTPPQGHEVLAAFGRLWVADFENNKSTIYWSDFLNGHAWSGGDSGSIDISGVWPDGYDEIVALSAHNNHLVIFGKHSIIAYNDAWNPASMFVADTVAGVGCVHRNSLQHTGTDIIFLSNTGLRSFGRTIQEKSMPISNLSSTISKDIIELVSSEPTGFSTVYSPENNFYLLTFINEDITYCFDVRGTLENGAYRVTRWPATGFTSFARLDNGKLYIGSKEGIGEYDGYLDNNQTYQFSYYSPSLTFGDPARTKFIKKVRPTIIGGDKTIVSLQWAYDFDESYSSQQFTAGVNATPALFGVAQFNIDKFTGGVQTSRTAVNTTGGGGTVVIGLQATINGEQLSLQEINVLALMGKVI